MCLARPGHLCHALGRSPPAVHALLKGLIPRKAFLKEMGSSGAGLPRQLVVHALERDWRTLRAFSLCPLACNFSSSSLSYTHSTPNAVPHHRPCPKSMRSVNHRLEPSEVLVKIKSFYFMSVSPQVFGYDNEKLASTGYHNKMPQNRELK